MCVLRVNEFIHLSLMMRTVAPFLLLGVQWGLEVMMEGVRDTIQKGPKYLWVSHCEAANEVRGLIEMGQVGQRE